MIEKITHAIITRFNVKTTGWSNVDKQGRPTRTEEWQRKRFGLFEQYYLPSMEIQTDKNFTCLVFFDVDTPEEFKQKITVYQKKYAFFKPIFVQDDKELGAIVSTCVRDLCPADTTYVLTTNIDNDDSIHKKALEIIHRSFVRRDMTALNLCKGYRFLNTARGLLLKNSFVNGPFITFVETYSPGKKIHTVLHYVHDHFFELYPTKQIRSGYYWIQNIHDSNVINDISGIPMLDYGVLKDFGIDTTNVHLDQVESKRLFLKYITNIKNFIPFEYKAWILRCLGKRTLPAPNL
jgi:hypothetical protein